MKIKTREDLPTLNRRKSIDIEVFINSNILMKKDKLKRLLNLKCKQIGELKYKSGFLRDKKRKFVSPKILNDFNFL